MKSMKTPAEEYLFTVNPNSTNMDAEKEYEFQKTIAKALFICKR